MAEKYGSLNGRDKAHEIVDDVRALIKDKAGLLITCPGKQDRDGWDPEHDWRAD